MAHVLGIGIATLDIINVVERYPAEDAEVRAVSQRRCRGGNATNTLVVLSQLGHVCAWGGVLVDEPDAAAIRADLEHYRVDTRHCRIEPRGKVPTSYITLSRENGSRTIVHYRDLPEFGADDFARIDLARYDWLHCEGRAVDETVRMLARARGLRPDLPRSVEIEKPRPGIEALFADAGLLLFARGYAEHRGFSAPQPFLDQIHQDAPQADSVCTWGADGSFALGRDGRAWSRPAYAPAQVIDTLGAGDTFNAGFIDARLRGADLGASLEAANRLAGRKCGQHGFEGLIKATGYA